MSTFRRLPCESSLTTACVDIVVSVVFVVVVVVTVVSVVTEVLCCVPSGDDETIVDCDVTVVVLVEVLVLVHSLVSC